MRRKRRNHSPAPRVALGAVKDERTLAELSQQFDVHANQITQWKRQLIEGAAITFDNGSSAADSQAHVAELDAKFSSKGQKNPVPIRWKPDSQSAR